MNTNSQAHSTPICPRCGYDLQGLVATWHTQGPDTSGASCPTAGTCSECGLLFEWRLALSPHLANVPWFVECQHAMRLAYSTMRTSIRALFPFVFWRHVALESPRNATRRAWWLLCTLLIWPFLVSATLLVVSCIAVAVNPSPTVIWNGSAWVVSAPPSSWDLLVSRSLAVFPNAASVFTSPILALASVLRVEGAALLLCGSLSGAAGFPLMLVVLPFSRAKSKVRIAHLARASAYALAPTPLLVALICYIVYDYGPLPVWVPAGIAALLSFIVNPMGPSGLILLGAPLVWFALWWFFALRTGFRMKDWLPVLISMLIPTALLSLVLAVLVMRL
jgi:hypothetical protein